MSTQHPAKQKSTGTNAKDFAGFADWFEIFRAGEQTDSKGRKRNFTHADLDSMVANHDASAPFPFVLGHPADNDPAYGWGTDVMRDGDKLLAKGRATVPEFEAAVRDELFPNRSISVVEDGKGGFKIRHLGWLGAKVSAVEGMQRLNFSASDAESVYSFSASATPRVLRTIKRLFRALRENLIERESTEVADRVIPEWDIDSIDDAADDLDAVARGAAAMFSQSKEELIMTDINRQAEVDAANQRAKALQDENATLKAQLEEKDFARAKDEAGRIIELALREGRLLPSMTQGLAEFIAALPDDDSATFSFAAADGKPTKANMRAFFMDFLAEMPKQISLGARQDDPPEDGSVVSSYQAPAGFAINTDRAQLDQRARDYASKNNVDYVTAYKAVGGT